MKKILLFLLVLGSLVGSSQSLPTIPGFTNINQKYQWFGVKPPPDTIYSKFGLASVGDSLYFGNGVFWRNIGKDYSVQLLPDGVVNGCVVVWSGSGLTYTVTTPCSYNIGGTAHSLAAAVNVTLPVGTASPGEFRTDAIVVNTANTATSVLGDNSVSGVGETAQEDPATQLKLTYVRIDEDDTAPANTSLTVVRDEGSGGEWYANERTMTIDTNYATTPYHLTKSTRITAAANNQYLQFRTLTPQSKAAYSTLLFYIRNNSVLNNNRNLIVRLYNNTTQIGVALNITTYGYSKTLTGSYQTIAIPMSAFTGADAFNRIRITNTGTGGTVALQIDYVQLQSGIITNTPSVPAYSLFYGNTGFHGATGPGSKFVFIGKNGINTPIHGDTIDIDGSANQLTNIGPGFRNAVEGTNQVLTDVPGALMIYDSVSNPGSIVRGVDTSKLQLVDTTTGSHGDPLEWVEGRHFRVTPGGGGSGLFPVTGIGTATGPVIANIGTYPLTIKSKDSIGYYIDADWTTGSTPANVTLGIGTGTSSSASGGMTIGGTLGKNLNNAISFQKIVGSENFTATWTGIMAAKSNTSYGLSFIIPPSTGIGQGITAQFHMSDTSGYLSYMGVANPFDYVTTTKHSSILHWASTDTIDFYVNKSHRSVVIKMTDRNTGAEARMDIKDITFQNGVPSLYFYSGIKLIEHLKIKIDQVLRPKVIALGTSIPAGYYASTYQGGYPQLVFDAVGGQNTLMSGSAENVLDAERRFPEIIAANPEAVTMDYNTNNVSLNIDTVGKVYRRVIAGLVAANIKVVLVTAVNSITNLTPLNDTLKAIAATYTASQVQVADVFAVNVNPAGGTAINPDYNFDDVHYNNFGHRSASTVVIGALKKLISFQPAQVRMQLPVTSNTDLPVLRLGKDNELFSSYTPQDTASILNKKTISNADIQGANFNISGEGAMKSIRVVGGGTLLSTESFKITPAGTITINPFSVNGGGFYTSPGQVTTQGGGQFWFTDGADIRTHLQGLDIINRTPTSFSRGVTINNLNDGVAVTPSYLPFRIQRTDTTVLTVNSRGRINSSDSTVYVPATHGGYSFVVRRKGAAGLGDYELVDSSAVSGGGGGGGATAFTGLSDVPASYSGQALKVVRVNAGETALEFVSGAGAGADAQLSNLSGTTAVPVAILPATDNAIALGSAAKRWTNLFLANGASINWNNGTSLITSTGGSSMALQSDNGLFQFYKSGQQGNIQIYNSTLADGIDLKSGSQAIDPISSTSYLILSSTASRKIGIGGTPAANQKLSVQTTSLLSSPYPVMTTSQRNAISTPAAGDGVYCSDCTASDASTGVITIYNGSTWKNAW